MLRSIYCLAVVLSVVAGQGFPGGPFPGSTQPCYSTPANGHNGGECIQTDCCAGQTWISNLCPNYGNNIRCCYSYNSCTTPCGTCNDPVAKQYACMLMEMQEKGQLRLKPEHFSEAGNNPYDGASSLSNIRDTCYGRQARRSNYCSTTIGGCVCLKGAMVKGLYEYASSFWAQYGQPVDVNSLAGSCHGQNSWHYQGNTFDVSCTTPFNHCTALTNWCLSQNIVEACYPGSSCGGHDTWVHCAFA